MQSYYHHATPVCIAAGVVLYSALDWRLHEVCDICVCVMVCSCVCRYSNGWVSVWRVAGRWHSSQNVNTEVEFNIIQPWHSRRTAAAYTTDASKWCAERRTHRPLLHRHRYYFVDIPPRFYRQITDYMDISILTRNLWLLMFVIRNDTAHRLGHKLHLFN